MRRVQRAVALALAVGLAGCSGWQSALDPHGTDAARLAGLMWFVMATCAAVWVLVVLTLAPALWRRRAPRPDPLALDAPRERRMRAVIAGAVGATVVVISVFTLTSFVTTRGLGVTGSDEPTIRVRGRQWWWEVEYLDRDPARAFKTANEIHVPVGRPVRLRLEGDDVIHSFWVPSLAGKQDMIPGRTNELVIRAERPGLYRGQCAEFCGIQHAHMAFLVVAEDEVAYARWLEIQRSDAAPPSGPEQEAGRAAFLSRQCAACHTVRGTPAAGTTGPDLTHVGSRRTIGAGLLDTTRGAMAAWIADPQTLKPGNNMPLVPLDADALRDISAYLVGLE
ncbi:cytochrome c oxidase subunit II [Rhodoplanes roseus]|uniref:cytochrome-c oxidase n=1 Tax=Rhodoplanes roseus TaxID=29409 RepID=A0A327KL43_9BRAD|nr:cytochrome c oxidase subunit II [Rhodoplanes roseus]RAI38961.1 cytochrome c oxidase subunit II [Rhodoplanes roseus]